MSGYNKKVSRTGRSGSSSSRTSGSTLSGVTSRDGSRGSVSARDVDVPGLNPLFGDIPGTSFDEMLKGLNDGNAPGNLSSDFLKSFSSILQGYGSNASSERTDMLMEYLLKMLATSEQRDWDKSVLAEQRNYDTPTNQLSRLMGAGISRDAAIQLLSGGGSGASAGSALIGSGASVSAPTMPAPSGTTEIARTNALFGGVSSIANMLVNLCSQGMQMAQAYETYQFQKNQTYMSSQQVQDYDAANNVNQQLQVLSDSGLLGKNINEFRSTNDLTSYLRSISDNNTAIQELLASPSYKRAIGSIFGRDYLNNIMASRRSSNDAGHIADLAITQAELSNNLAQVSAEKLSADVSKMRKEEILIDAQAKETLQRIAESQAKISYINAQGELIKVQTEQANLQYELLDSGFPLLKENRLSELRLQAAKWRALYHPEEVFELTGSGMNKALQAQIDTWLKNPQNASDVAYLQSLRNNALAGFAENHPTLWSLVNIFSDLGILDMVKVGTEVAGIVSMIP